MIPQGYNLSFRQLSGCIRPGRGVGVLISAPDLDLGSLLSQSAMLLLVQYAQHSSFPTPCVSHLFFLSSDTTCHACPSLIFPLPTRQAHSQLPRIIPARSFLSPSTLHIVLLECGGFYLSWVSRTI